MLGAAPGRGRDRRRSPRSPPVATTGWPGRKGARCGATPIGPMPGPPPPCGMQKVLCRLRWQTSAPMSPGRHEADLGVHVGAVHVDLAAVRVDDRADLADRLLEDAVGRGVGDHQRGRGRRACSAALRREVGEVDVAARRRRRPATTLKPGHHRAGGVGAVRGDGDQADVAVPLAAALVVGADRRAGRRTRPASRRWAAARRPAKPVISAEPALEVGEQLARSPAACSRRREGVQPAELGPGDRDHLGWSR